MFHILSLATNELILGEFGEPLAFETGALAAERAKALSEANPEGGKFQPRKAVAIDDPNWHTRETIRFESGTYTRPNESLRGHCPASHYVHVSRDKPDMLAYTESDAKGRADVQRRRKVVSYLEEFAAYLSKEQRAAIAAEHAAAFSVGVKFAVTPDEIEAVYTNYEPRAEGVSDSCMRYNKAWDGDEHPVRVYGDSDLQVAYLTNEEGQTTHRALIWPAQKVYSRVYGDSSSFHAALKALGYTKSHGYYGSAGGDKSLEGARIRAIDCGNGYVMPYIDECDTVALSRDRQWFILGGDGYDCQQTGGATEDASCTTCERCDDRTDEEDTYTVYTRVSPSGLGRGDETWCSHCYENHTFYCEGVNETFSNDVHHADADNGHTYTVAYLRDNANQCEHTEEWTFDDLVTVIIDTDDGETAEWCEGAVTSDAFICRVTGELYSHDCARDGTLESGHSHRDGTGWRGINDGATDGEIEAALGKTPRCTETPDMLDALIAAE